MAFACRLYKSTGFNTINVPDKPSLLDSFSYADTDVIDVISTYNNHTIRVKLAQAPDWQYYDYMRLGSGSNIANRAYYAITGFRFTSPDVIEFSVVQDAWLTLGGLDGFTNGEINILSGTTRRHHIPKDEDTYSDYNEDDEMLIPSDPIKVLKTTDIGGYIDDHSQGRHTPTSATLVRTSVDLIELANQLPDVINFPVQSLSGDVTGNIPSPADFCYPKLVSDYTRVGLFSGRDKGFTMTANGARAKYYGAIGTESENTDVEFRLPNEAEFVAYGVSIDSFSGFASDVGKVNTGLSRARGMGYDTAVTASYSLPANAVSGRVYSQGSGQVDMLVGKIFVNAIRCVHEIGGQWYDGRMPEEFEFEYWARNAIDDGSGNPVDLNNLRAIKGEYFKYEIVALSSGQKAEFLGENIVKASADIVGPDTYHPEYTGVAGAGPILLTICDPRPDGCPYFAYYDERNFVNIYNNSIKGLKWTEAPIRYEVSSGQAVESRRLANNTRVKDASARFENALVKAQQVRNDANSVIGAIGDFVSGDWASAANRIQSPVLRATVGSSDIGDRAIYGYDEVAQNQMRRFIERKAEQEEFFVNASVQVPEINFPMNDSIKEAVGNGALLVRYSLTGKDIAKFDKILNMYGYKHTAAIDESMLDNRSEYNYIEAAGVTFGGTAAKFLREDLANMFTSGIRIWHVAPDPALYVGTSNS